ncbi:MAG: replicative helicase loader/inhibitor [Candidatus Uhrbacteria bacterium]|nr:replicative helicase loader/inhibitor [Candidatus Uhrbacteria bacterium]
MASQIDVAKIVAMLSAAYPNWSANEYTTQVYYDDLKDIETSLLITASNRCRTESGRKFAPSVGEIRGMAGQIKREILGVPSALEAWGELLTAPKNEETRSIVENTIEIRPYQWSHPLVRKVAVLMGFPRFPDWDSESFERAAYIKQYDLELIKFIQFDDDLPQVKNYITSESPALLSMGKLTKKLEAK